MKATHGTLKHLAKKTAEWLASKPWLLYPMIGLAWALAILGVLTLQEKIVLDQWRLHPYLAVPGNVINGFEQQSIDWRFGWRGAEQAPGDIIILAIDEESLIGTNSQFGEGDFKENHDLKLLMKWPYPREAWAKIIQKLIDAGVKVIGIDVVFGTASNYGSEDDLIFQKTLVANQKKLVLAADFHASEPGVRSNLLIPNDVLMEPFEKYSDILGVVNYNPGAGDVIRTSVMKFPEADLDSFASMVAQKAGRRVSPEGFWINYAGGRSTFKTLSLYKILYSLDWKGRINREGKKEGGTFEEGKIFKDKIVLIGATAAILQDFHTTPFGIMPGVETHANTISNFLGRPKLRLFHSWLVLAGVGLFQGLLISFFRRPVWKVFPALLVLVVIGLVSRELFIHSHLITPLFAPWLIASLTSISIIISQATSEFLARQKTRKTLETYVSPNVAAFILQNQDAYQAAQAGIRKPCTILFSDIRGFTTLTENSPDETKLVEHLNEYLTEMVHCVFEYGGTLHKFMGDGIMAAWGDTHSDGEKADALAAVMTTLAMRRELARLNDKWTKEGKSTLRIGIGLNHGTVVAGAIGSKDAPLRLEYTIIGDAVNVASRVETETKAQAVDVLISKSVYELVQDDVDAESRGAITLKGKAEKVELFHLKGLRTR